VKCICLTTHEVDRDDNDVVRHAHAGCIGQISFPTPPDQAWMVEWDNNGGWGFYSRPELEAVAVLITPTSNQLKPHQQELKKLYEAWRLSLYKSETTGNGSHGQLMEDGVLDKLDAYMRRIQAVVESK